MIDEKYRLWRKLYYDSLWVMYRELVSTCIEDQKYKKIRWKHNKHFDDFCRLIYQTS